MEQNTNREVTADTLTDEQIGDVANMAYHSLGQRVLYMACLEACRPLSECPSDGAKDRRRVSRELVAAAINARANGGR